MKDTVVPDYERIGALQDMERDLHSMVEYISGLIYQDASEAGQYMRYPGESALYLTQVRLYDTIHAVQNLKRGYL